MPNEILTKAQYDYIKEYYRCQNGYDDMSPEQKERFDHKLDNAMNEIYDVEDAETSPEGMAGVKEMPVDEMRENIKERVGYDAMNQAEREKFDLAYDELYGEDKDYLDMPSENVDYPEKTYTLR